MPIEMRDKPRLALTGAEERLARIEALIVEYRKTKQRQVLKQAIALWQEARAEQVSASRVRPVARVH